MMYLWIYQELTPTSYHEHEKEKMEMFGDVGWLIILQLNKQCLQI